MRDAGGGLRLQLIRLTRFNLTRAALQSYKEHGNYPARPVVPLPREEREGFEQSEIEIADFITEVAPREDEAGNSYVIWL